MFDNGAWGSHERGKSPRAGDGRGNRRSTGKQDIVSALKERVMGQSAPKQLVGYGVQLTARGVALLFAAA
jgi:hypothetical protein